MLDPDSFIVQTRDVELADQIRIEESRPLVERVLKLLSQGCIGADAHLDLRLADVKRGGRQQSLEDGLVNGNLRAPDVVEDKPRVLEIVHHLKLQVDRVNPVTEGRIVELLRELPDSNLLLVEALVPAVRAALAEAAALPLAVDVRLRRARTTSQSRS